jgi:hypothetical protein
MKMSEVKHTPGPWTFDGPPDSIIVWCGPDERVAFILTSDGPAEANARLIAAAPELYAALERLERTVRILPSDMDEPDSPLAQARAALAKVEA